VRVLRSAFVGQNAVLCCDTVALRLLSRLDAVIFEFACAVRVMLVSIRSISRAWKRYNAIFCATRKPGYTMLRQYDIVRFG
jgi:hypothetical protein